MSIFPALFRRRRAVKENPVARVILLGTGGRAVWTPADYRSLSEAGYRNCWAVYACVRKIIEAACGLQFKLERAGKDAPDHPLLKRLNHPNPEQSRRGFIGDLMGYLLLAGNSYISLTDVARTPMDLYALRPDRMTVLPGTGNILVGGYTYTVAGNKQTFDPEHILHLKYFNPLHDYYGLSPLEVARRSIDISNLGEEWNAKLIENDMRPSGVLSVEGNLTDGQFDRLKGEIKDQYQGADNAGTPMVLEGGMKWQQLAMNPADLDWLQGDQANTRKICAIFGVAPELIGDASNKTYSNFQEARRALYTETVLPLMGTVTDALQVWLAHWYGEELTLTLDRDAIEALQEDRGAKFGYVGAAEFLTVNEKREALGYDRVGPEGDVILVSFNRIPIDQIAQTVYVNPELNPDGTPVENGSDELVSTGTIDDDGKVTEDGKPKKAAALPPASKADFWGSAPERKELLWKTFDQRVKARGRSFETLARAFLQRQADDVRAKIDKADNLSSLRADDLLDTEAEGKRFLTASWPWYVDHFERAGNAGVHATRGELFDDSETKAKKPTSWTFDMSQEQAKKLRSMVFDSGTKVAKTSIAKIHNLLLEAQAEGWTVPFLKQQIGDKLDELSHSRARNWAVTESTKIDNYGQLEGYKTIEFVERKGWLCSGVPASRDAHLSADGQVVGLDEEFDVGGESMAYPGDPKGNPSNVCGCLCSIYPVVGEV